MKPQTWSMSERVDATFSCEMSTMQEATLKAHLASLVYK